jgi:hypothetical protein
VIGAGEVSLLPPLTLQFAVYGTGEKRRVFLPCLWMARTNGLVQENEGPPHSIRCIFGAESNLATTLS